MTASSPAAHMRLQHALADNLRILLRLNEEAQRGNTSANVQRWARIFENTLMYLADSVPLLESEHFPDAALTNIISAVNQAQSGLVTWLAFRR